MKKLVIFAVLIITAFLSGNAQSKKVLFVLSAEDTLIT
jgi:outer membrane murein-binding lipoprotein Lpp